MNQQIAISQFKSHCLEIITNLHNHKQAIIITKRDKPIARVEAIFPETKTLLFGLLKGRAEIKGDIMESINEKWNALDE